MSTEVITFGCRLNAFESEVIRTNAEKAGLADTVIFNTCTVTSEAVRQARQAIRKARRERPDARVIVTGCAAQVDADEFAAMDEVDEVIGNIEKLDARQLSRGRNSRVRVNDIMAVRDVAGHMIDGFDGRTRAFVQVQTGCDHRCTFCIIPYARGNSRSVPIAQVVEQISRLVDKGFKEVVLTGVDLTSYGPDLDDQPTLGELCQAIMDEVPDLPRVRLSSIDSIEVGDRLFDIIAHQPRLMPHLHLSLQSGDDLILKRMKRRHSAAEARDFCARVREARADIVFGADLIAGFPTETDAMFDNTLRHVEDCGLSFLHVFPYSRRPGTPADKMPMVPTDVRKTRAKRLRQAGDAARDRLFGGLAGTAQKVLIERISNGTARGHTPGFAPIAFETDLEPGAIVPVRVTGHADGMLSGNAAK